MSADPPLRRPHSLPKQPPPEECESVSVTVDIDSWSRHLGYTEARDLQDPGPDHAFPRISIITCTHNRPDMLRGAAGSVRAQTRGDWEHLVADAGSMVPGADDAPAPGAA